MSYQMKFEDVLIPTWEAWDGTGVYDIPGKNITLNNGLSACILLDLQGIAIYHKSLDEINHGENDMGDLFIEMADSSATADRLLEYISAKDVEEAKIVYDKYIARDESWVE